MAPDRPPELPAFICTCVFQHTRPVLLVSHEGGDWQFLCGEPHEDVEASLRVVGLNHVIEHDPTLIAMLELPNDMAAERDTVVSPWRVFSAPSESE